MTTVMTILAAMCLMAGPALAERTDGEVIDDAGLHAQMKTNMVASDVVDANDVNIEVDKGVVQLSGFVDSEAARDEAGRIAADIIGVKSVSNKLAIKGADRSLGTVAKDQYIETKVDAALIADEMTDAGDIDVDVRNGVVQLSGFVGTDAEKQRATEVAMGIEGVTRVDNVLDLKN